MKASTPRAQQAEQVKAGILDAAIPLFARGFDSVAVQQIAAAAGCKHSLVMYHFGTKERLWELATERLMQQFDARHQQYWQQDGPPPDDDALVLRRLLLAFILALRDIPAYGQILLTEGVHPSPRLRWLHERYFPSAYQNVRLKDARLIKALTQATLVRHAMSGALLYSVTAAPQLALTASQQGGEAPSDLYPLSQALAEKLADMLTAFVLSNR